MDNSISTKLQAPQDFMWRNYCIPFWEAHEPMPIRKRDPAYRLRDIVTKATRSSLFSISAKIKTYKF